MGAQRGPFLLAEFHALPIVIAAFILGAEVHAPGFVRCALGVGNMGLELHPMGAGAGDGVHIAVGRVQTTVVGLRHLGDDGAAFDAGKQGHGDQATFRGTFRHSRKPLKRNWR